MNSGKILVVEDEAFIAHDIKRILDAQGYSTIIDCFSVDSAMELMQSHQPDLVLIDINLGSKKTGIDLAEYLDKVFRVPYIFITSYTDRSTLSQVANCSPSGYITKPFKPGDLISNVFLALSKVPAVALADPAPVVAGTIPFAITQVLDHIDKHISEKLDVDVLARMTSWEPEYFSRIFKEHIGMPPYQYVLKAKIERSKQLLAETSDSSQTICFELGFSSYGNFYNAFRKYVQMTPERYRKLVSASQKG